MTNPETLPLDQLEALRLSLRRGELTLLCSHCEKEFKPSRLWQKFCGYSCQREHNSQKFLEARQQALNELVSLRAENARLKNLLQQQGISYDPD